MNKTLDYYNEKATEFVEGTINADMSKVYDFFLKHIPQGGHVLDLGCGSGRDSKAFMDKGYTVTAVDGSEECCKLASEYIGQDVVCATFEELHFKQKFDGIWACASILHCSKSELNDIFKKLRNVLKDNGILYCSFKYGDFEGERNGRYFTDLTEDSLTKIINGVGGFKLIETAITRDVRDSRNSEKWLNIILNHTRCCKL